MRLKVEINGVWSTLSVAVAALLVLLTALPAQAQSPVRIVGAVQWV
jgi:hypothetical protein